MKPVPMFVLGAVLAGGVVYLATNRPTVETVAPPQTVQQPAVAQPAAETPEANPDAAAPVAAPEREPEPVRAVAARPVRKPSPAPIRSTRQEPVATPKPAPAQQSEPPVTVAQNTTPPVQPPPPPAQQPVVLPPPPVEEPKLEPRQPQTVTIPGGTLLTVRLDEELSTEKNQSGDSFRATLDQPLVVDGYVIAERGARVEGRVAEVDAGGRVKGVSRLSLELVRLTTSDGQRVRLHTESFSKQAERSRSKDIAKVGAAAGIGAAIGAIAGGGKGAAIGAAVGGAAGTGGVMATRGEPAELPSETRVSFRLSQPITITEKL